MYLAEKSFDGCEGARTNILFSLFRSATSRKCTSFFRRPAPQECHPEWENGVQKDSEKKKAMEGSNDLYRRAKTQKLRGWSNGV